MDVRPNEFDSCLPELVAVDGLHSLRRITLANHRYYYRYNLNGHGHNEEERCCPMSLPPSVKVSPAVPVPTSAQRRAFHRCAGAEPICRFGSSACC